MSSCIYSFTRGRVEVSSLPTKLAVTCYFSLRRVLNRGLFRTIAVDYCV